MAAALVPGADRRRLRLWSRCRRRGDRDRGGHRRPGPAVPVSEIVDAELVSTPWRLTAPPSNSGLTSARPWPALVIARWDTVAMLLNAASFLVVIAVLSRWTARLLHPAPLRGAAVASSRGATSGAARPAARVPLLVFVLGTFGMNFQITTALMASVEFHQPMSWLLGSVMVVGSWPPHCSQRASAQGATRPLPSWSASSRRQGLRRFAPTCACSLALAHCCPAGLKRSAHR